LSGRELHLVDGTYELFRAHYAPRPGHLAPSATDGKATVGIVESLLHLTLSQNFCDRVGFAMSPMGLSNFSAI
jgi:hypothetical protein